MGLEELRCVNCGSILALQENGQYVCQHCGTTYKDKEEINNNIVNHNETIIQNYYGTAAKKETNRNQIDGFFNLLIDAFVDGYYSKAFSYCNKILNLDTTNEEALILKRYLSDYRLSARKFFKQSLYLVIYSIIDKDFLGNKPENRRHLMRFVYNMIVKLSTIASVEDLAEHNFECIAHLKKYFDGKNCNDGEFLELKEKTDNLVLQFGKIAIDKEEKEKKEKIVRKYSLIGAIIISILAISLFISIFFLSEHKTNLGIYDEYYAQKYPDNVKQLKDSITRDIIFIILEIISLITTIGVLVFKVKKTNKGY